jgi:hypothetical protein
MTYTKKSRHEMRDPCEPAVLHVHLVADTGGAEVNLPVYVPWEKCRLAYAYTVTTVAEGDKGDVDILLELDAADATAIMGITVLKNAAVGDIDEATFSAEASGLNLGADISARDAINISVDSVNTTTWQGSLYMYFEPWLSEWVNKWL